ncbi:TadE/TadG family type IV pilus assembly protein [Rhodovulum adriaticum]|uniref:Flp pilus assembly protein TadG n=1 Tax=Rhodovulum adriaticum TaxID=35804 RepID=A0A4R2NLR1_RHOAD|nr:TadE/TadG family type IV pilus assembly protein [Rhodovulum adriaticum]MBK1635734.1 hypothetical protein [Rhodovulum adriaticum]TCP22471.1 Flp pilus assembly protein TadG [Rhodovulum adriaticum]
MPIKKSHNQDAARGSVRSLFRLARFQRDESGGIVIFSLFLFITMLAMAGLAIDFMRHEMARTQLQGTLDRAVLAATGLGNSLDAEDVVLDYFAKAGLSDYISSEDITVVENKSSGTLSYRRVTATADAEIDTYLLKLVNLDTLTVSAGGTAEEGITDLEISMVLDVSGSMSNWSSSSRSSKIAALKEAAKDFVYYMQCNQAADRDTGAACTTEANKVSISIVPYSEQVYAGPTLLSEFNVTDEHDYSACVDFADSDFSNAALLPTEELQRTGHFDRWSGGSTQDGYPGAYQFTCEPESWREIKPLMNDHNDVFAAIDALQTGGNTSIDLGVKWGMTLLDPAVRSVVTNLTVKSRPGEEDPVIDTAFVGRPYDYTQAYNMKVLVVMSDGQHTTQYYLKDEYRDGPSEIWHYRLPDGDGGWTLGDDIYSVYSSSRDQYMYVDDDRRSYYPDGDNSTWHDEPYAGEAETVCETERKRVCYWIWCFWEDVQVCDESDAEGEAYQMSYPEVWAKFPTDWYDDFDFLPNPVNGHNRSTKDDRLHDICEAAKAEGVLVYTIGFEVSENSAAETAMQDCASNANNYFAANGANLADVFATIATSINKLRLTQ